MDYLLQTQAKKNTLRQWFCGENYPGKSFFYKVEFVMQTIRSIFVWGRELVCWHQLNETFSLTFFCLYWIAILSRFNCIRSPCCAYKSNVLYKLSVKCIINGMQAESYERKYFPSNNNLKFVRADSSLKVKCKKKLGIQVSLKLSFIAFQFCFPSFSLPWLVTSCYASQVIRMM